MRHCASGLCVVAMLFLGAGSSAQMVMGIRPPDARYKTDILVVVAHPDDEGGVTPYLARAIYDLHKQVAVVFATRGGSGGNDYSREHGGALANIREIEAREGCAKLGITNVWFLDGQDTASQNVLNSLANWGHGDNLEKLVGIFRLTRPEIVITWLPSVFIGENHGDHQAAGVLATEAFDLANDPTAFPSQVSIASKRLEPYLQNLTPWQAKKIYFFSDANNDKQFAGKGPSYSIKEISPSQKKPYWRLALDAATPHRTQFPHEIEQISKLSDEQIEKMMANPDTAWWSDPMTLIFGKATVATKPTDDVFANPSSEPTPGVPQAKAVFRNPRGASGSSEPRIELAGVWEYYRHFRAAHQLMEIPVATTPEIGIKSGSILTIPLQVLRTTNEAVTLTIKVHAPNGWKVLSGEGQISLAPGSDNRFLVEVETPKLSSEELKKTGPQEVTVSATAGGQSLGEVTMRVALQNGDLPQN